MPASIRKHLDLVKLEERLRTNFSQHLYLLEAIFYIAVSILLSAAAAVAVCETGVILWRGITAHTLTDYGLLMLDRLLFVLMLVEILHTVRISIHSKDFMLVKPFLIIALIASVRRVLVITMEAANLAKQGQATVPGEIAFRSAMVELGLLGFMVLVFAFSIYLLSRTSTGKTCSAGTRSTIL